MSAICLIILSLIYIASSQCSWNLGDHSINIGALAGSRIQCAFESFEVLYSPCRDDVSCGIGGKYMAVQNDVGENTCAAYLANWDGSVTPQYGTYDDGSDMFQFPYANGEASGGCGDGRYLDVEYVCDEDAYPYNSGKTDCGEEAQSCHYFIRIFTNLACPGGGGDPNAESDSLSGGWIFIIIIISCIFGYCFVGFIFNGTKNKEWTIPNAPFWVSFPRLVLTGCMVSKEYVMRKMGKDVNDTDDGYELNDPSS